MHALPYLDSLVKEYLLFRGFTRSLQAFSADTASDQSCGFQADALASLVFKRMIPQHDGNALVELLAFLQARLFRHLDADLDPAIWKLQVSVLRCYLVHATQAGKPGVVRDFFAQHGDALLAGPSSDEWAPWFALPFLRSPATDPRFQAFFAAEWARRVEASFHNLVAEAVQGLPLPALLGFDANRAARLSLKERCAELEAQNARMAQALRQRLASGASAAAAGVAPGAAPGPADWGVVGQHLVDPNYLDTGAPARRTSDPSAEAQLPVASLRQSSQRESGQRPAAANGAASGVRRGTAGREWGAGGTASGSLSPEGRAVPEEAPRRATRAGSFAEWHELLPRQTENEGLGSKAEGASRDASVMPAPPLPPEQVESGGSGANDEGRTAGEPTRDGSGPLRGGAAAATGGEPSTCRDMAQQVEQLVGHEEAACCAVWSPSGRNAVTAAADGVVRIWAPESLPSDSARAAVLLCGATVTALAWDGRADKILLVGTRRRGVKCWHVDTKRMVEHVAADLASPDVLDLACSPTEPTFAAATAAQPGASDQAVGRLALWNLRAFKRVATFSLAGEPALRCLDWARDGRTLIAAGTDGTARLLDVASRAEVASWSVGGAGAAAWLCCGAAPNTAVSLSALGMLQWWDLAMLREPTEEVDANRYCRPGRCHCFALSPCGAALALTSDARSVPLLLRASTRGSGGWRWAAAGAHGGAVQAVDWHPTLPVVLSAAADRSVHVTHLPVASLDL
ncbi:hypothetical protein WJX81_003570 [Elliptochloris bilobata]|uniref:ARMC9 CTLH-like domain-containing protein n=1 Tax=Elliptochloris bilobata TaxID=381761 RepID=A0AAW1S8C1_9CHLO